VEEGKGLQVNQYPPYGKFIKTYAPGSSEHLAISKLDQIVLAFNAFVAQWEAFLSHADAAAGAPLGTSNHATYSATAITYTASDELIQSPKLTSI
jgi:hypothetical protein